jgi:hypothetical protein
MDSETLDRLATTPKTLAHLVAEASDEVLDRAGPDGGWSARTVLAHFRDGEFLEFRLAVERMLAEERPELRFIPAEDWEAGRSRERERKEWMLGDFALQRQASLGILRGLRAEEWARVGTLGEREMTLEQFVGMWARHDAGHVSQLEAALGETLADVLARRARPEE